MCEFYLEEKVAEKQKKTKRENSQIERCGG